MGGVGRGSSPPHPTGMLSCLHHVFGLPVAADMSMSVVVLAVAWAWLRLACNWEAVQHHVDCMVCTVEVAVVVALRFPLEGAMGMGSVQD